MVFIVYLWHVTGSAGEKTFANHLSPAEQEGCPAPQGGTLAPLALLSPSAQLYLLPDVTSSSTACLRPEALPKPPVNFR